MDSDVKRVAIVTGASSGIGAACAREMLRNGYRVFCASRTNADPIDSEDFHFIYMDVTQNESVLAAVAEIWEREHRIDILVNNAGYSLVGAVEDTSDEEVSAQLNVNLLGPWRLARAVVPLMRGQGSGCIINIGSIGGCIGLPFQAAYSASKFGLAGLTEALSAELADWPIRVILFELGNYRTAITKNRILAKGAVGSKAYAGRFERAKQLIDRAELQGHSPEGVAKQIVRAARSSAPRLSYRSGPLFERLAPSAKAILPSRLFECLLIREYR